MSDIFDNEGLRVQSIKYCYLCGNAGKELYTDLRDRLFYAPGIWNLRRCTHCRLVWVDPRPLPEELSKLYLKYYTHTFSDASQRNLSVVKEAVKRNILATVFGYKDLETSGSNRLLGKIMAKVGFIQDAVGSKVMWLHASRRGRLLDVGSGSGAFLARMRDLGWDVAGVEPDPEGARFARARYGLQIHNSTLADAALQENSFDVLTIHHVIEHVSDPVEFLRRCRRVLKPGGRVILVTPNIKSLGHYIFSRFWMPLDPPRHLLLFSPTALGNVVKLAGFQIERTFTPTSGARDSWYFSYVIRRSGFSGINIQNHVTQLRRLEGYLFWGVEYLFSRVCQCGEEIVVIAEKN